MQTLWQDIRYGARMLLKHKGFTLIAVFALALGIGANTAIFSVVNAVLLKALPYTDAERLVTVYGAGPQTTDGRAPLSYPDFVDYKTQSKTLQPFAAYQQIGTTLTLNAEPERVLGTEVSADLFPLLGIQPLLGRAFTAADDSNGAPPVIVISHNFWQQHFNADPNIVGREIKRGTRSVTVIGVMPQGFKFPAQAEKVDVYLPLVAELARTSPGLLTARDERFMPVVARLAAGATLEAAQTEMDGLARRIEQQFPATHTGDRIRLVSLHEDIVSDIRPALLVLLGAVGFVLLIACANVANLLLARAASRGKEMAIRTALGASRARVVRQLLTESLLLAMAGGALGLLLAWWGIDLLAASIPADVPRASDVNLDARVLLFTFAASLVTGIVFGLAPALASSKSDVSESLKEGGRGSTVGGSNRARSLLVVSEVALSLMLLVGAGLLVRSFFQLLNTNPGYDTARVLSVTLPLSRAKYSEPEQKSAYLAQVIERIKALPGIEAVGATNQLPLGSTEFRNTFKIEGRPPAPPDQRLAARNHIATADYFRAMGIPLKRGRAFTDADQKSSSPVIVINDTLARRYFPNEEPVGKRIVIEDESNNPLPPREIVGVIGNVRHTGLDEKEFPEYYVPFLQNPDSQIVLAVQAAEAIEPASLAPAVRSAIKELDKDQLIWETRTMRERVAQSVAPRRFTMLLLGVFALVALLLASVGIFGVMNYTVAQRTHEIGIRIALGAQTRDVLRLVFKQGLTLILSGVLIGLLAAALLTRVIASLLFEVSAIDPATFVFVPLLLVGVALLACYIPARRATKVDPMIALRYE
ncbi:MAG: ABC transporter permease [Pyrinomonadaceae bacterium]